MAKMNVKAWVPDPEKFRVREYIPEQELDPTRTSTLRNSATLEVRKLFRELLKEVKLLIVRNKNIFIDNPLVGKPREVEFENEVESVQNFLDPTRVHTFRTRIGGIKTPSVRVRKILDKYIDQATDKGETIAEREQKALKIPTPTKPAFKPTPRRKMLRETLTNATTDLIVTIQQQFLAEVRQILQLGIVQGIPRGEIVNQIVQLTNTHKYRAERIVRTELIRATNASIRSRLESDGMEYWQWVASQERVPGTGETRKGKRTCELCQKLHATIVKIGDPFIIVETKKGKERIVQPPAHPNCRCTVRPATTAEYDKKHGFGPRVMDKGKLLELLDQIRRLPAYRSAKGTLEKIGITEHKYNEIMGEESEVVQAFRLLVAIESFEYLKEIRSRAIKNNNESIIEIIECEMAERLVK